MVWLQTHLLLLTRKRVTKSRSSASSPTIGMWSWTSTPHVSLSPSNSLMRYHFLHSLSRTSSSAPVTMMECFLLSQLAGWIGLQYIDELKLAELPSSKILPDLVFSMSLGGPRITIPLQQLVLPDLQVLPSSASDAKTRVCIQRSGSIVQDGTSIFSPLEPDAGSVQRYRLHGSLALPLFNMIQAPIVFGSMVLNTFDELVVDGLTKRTGIRNLVGGSGNASFLSSPLSSSSNAVSATCMRPAQCIGQQRYLSRLNACQGRSSPAS